MIPMLPTKVAFGLVWMLPLLTNRCSALFLFNDAKTNLVTLPNEKNKNLGVVGFGCFDGTSALLPSTEIFDDGDNQPWQANENPANVAKIINLDGDEQKLFFGGNDLVGGDSGERYGLDSLSEVVRGGRIVPSDNHVSVGSALELLKPSIKLSIGDGFQILMEGGECRGGMSSNVLDDEDELHVDVLRSGSESDEEADSTGVRQAKDTVGWIEKALFVLYEASFYAHFSLDGPKIDHDNGSEEESEGHYDDETVIKTPVVSMELGATITNMLVTNEDDVDVDNGVIFMEDRFMMDGTDINEGIDFEEHKTFIWYHLFQLIVVLIMMTALILFAVFRLNWMQNPTSVLFGVSLGQLRDNIAKLFYGTLSFFSSVGITGSAAYVKLNHLMLVSLGSLIFIITTMFPSSSSALSNALQGGSPHTLAAHAFVVMLIMVSGCIVNVKFNRVLNRLPGSVKKTMVQSALFSDISTIASKYFKFSFAPSNKIRLLGGVKYSKGRFKSLVAVLALMLASPCVHCVETPHHDRASDSSNGITTDVIDEDDSQHVVKMDSLIQTVEESESAPAESKTEGVTQSAKTLKDVSGEHYPDEMAFEKVKKEDQQQKNLINYVPDGHDTRSNSRPVEKFEDHLLLEGLYDDLEDDEYNMMIALMNDSHDQELDSITGNKAHLWPTESDVKSSDLALVQKGLSSEMKELEELHRNQLRGSIEGDENHLAIIPRVVDFLHHQVDQAKALKNIILNGSLQEVAAALSMYLDDTHAAVTIASSVDEGKEHALDLSVTNEEGRLHERKLQAFLSEEVAPEELVDILHLNEDGIDDMEHYASVMEDVERKLFPGSNRSRRSTQTMPGAPNFSMNGKIKEKPKFKLPRLRIFEQFKAKMSKHGRHLEENSPAPQCRETCESNDYKCNCQRLVDYARDLTWYDAAVMFLGGYVQGDPDVEDYGDLNVDFITDIDMFDVRNQLPEKMQSIKDKANEADQNMSETTCTALLSEVHTACGEDTCTEPNVDSFQLSVDQVGSFVNTHTKINVETIGNFYDFQRYTVQAQGSLMDETPLSELRPVRCCRDDEPVGEDESWYKSPIAISASRADSCPYTLDQKWTGETTAVSFPALPILRMTSTNIGGAQGSPTSTYVPPTDTWTVTGPSNGRIVSGTDNIFHYVNVQTTGQIDMRLLVRSFSGTESTHRTGLMIRQDSSSGAHFYSIVYCGDKRVRRFSRATSETASAEMSGDVWLRFTFGPQSYFRGYTSTDGIIWTILGPVQSNSALLQSSNFLVGITAGFGILEASDFTINGVRAVPNDLVIPATPPSVEGYTAYNQRMCNNDNSFLEVDGMEAVDEDGFVSIESAQECASHCNDMQDCVSFDFLANQYCRLSSSCDHFSLTDPDTMSIWYFKNVVPPSYKKFADRLCATGSSNNLATTTTSSVQECANQCSENHECVSFAYQNTGCRLSSTCHEYSDMSVNNSWNTYIKRDEDDDKDKGICPFLPFAQAKEFCEDQGGRLCTKSELENNCASFTGCSFDTSPVWSSTEATPMVCPATSFKTCGNFITAFLTLTYRLYDAAPLRMIRKVRIEIPRRDILWLREVQVFDSNGVNVARDRFEPFVTQSSILSNNNAEYGPNIAVDNNFVNVMATLSESNPWWEVDLGQDTKIKEIRIFNRRRTVWNLSNAIVTLKDASDREVARYQFGSVDWTEFTLPASFFIPNPMRVVQTGPANPTDFSNVRFPTEYNWLPLSDHGVASIDPQDSFLYGYESRLSTNTEDLFCGASQGPPSVLAQACDASMEFLLGGGVSIGYLTSIANDANEFDPEQQQPMPRWLEWYLNQNNTNSIESFNKWTDEYLKIEDPGDDPIWMEEYLRIQDQSPFILSQTQTFSETEILSIDEIYCVDKSISGDDQTLQSCRRAWLDDKTNRYSDMTWYTSIPYPTSDVAPYNETCEISFCDEDWLYDATPLRMIRKVRIEIPGSSILHVREVQVFDSNGVNVARDRFEPFVTQSSILMNNTLIFGPNNAVDNNLNSNNFIQTVRQSNPWWEVDLGQDTRIKEVRIFNRLNTSQTSNFVIRLSNATVTLKDASDQEIARYQFGSVDWTEFSLPASSFITNSFVTNPMRVAQDVPVNPTDFSNPFNEDTNAGCYAFWGYCRGYEPSRYQCKVFWDYCRTELDSRNPGWKYPRENCTDTKISDEDIVTCPEKWLNDLENPYADEREQDETCFNFWNYCRGELDEIKPDWEYPRPTCKDGEGIEIETCQEDWLNDNENPYDDTTDPECHDFWRYCHHQLVYKYPRYEWPLPAAPTVNDLLPGYCCLDTPLTTDTTTEFWGSLYNAARAEAGMKCANRGFWHQGMSAESCHNGGGQYFRNPCITLKDCIDARPRKGEDGYKDSFEEWVYENEVEIYDPNDQEQCERAREALDYDADYYNDYEVCETFDALLCDEMFEDLQFLDDIASEKPVEFEQGTYKEIEYPKDKPLFFQELPNEIPFMKTDEEGWDDAVDSLERARYSLGFVKDTAKDGIDKYIDWQEEKVKAKPVNCKKFQKKYELALFKQEMQKNVCDGSLKVVGLTVGKTLFGKGFVKGKTKSNLAYNACLKKHKATITTTFKARKKLRVCNQVQDVAVYLSEEGKFKLWAAHYLIKVSYEAVDIAFTEQSLDESKKIKEYDFVEATYNNLISQFEWTHDALGVMTNNAIKQHTQMREELQNRHQDITNDVNQYTMCMSNFLGNQIFNALPGTRTGPLSSTCQNILGVSGRRLEEGGGVEPFSLEVEFLPNSFIDKQDTIIENEEEIIKKENEILKNEKDMMKELNDIEDKEIEMIKKIDNMMSAMAAIQIKLDMDPTIDIDPKVDNNKSKKPKAKKPKAGKDEVSEKDIFNRKLLTASNDVMKRTIEAMEGKLDSVEDKMTGIAMKDDVDLIKDKVESMESKVESMESKVDMMEKSMKNIEDMLSKLLATGGVAAG